MRKVEYLTCLLAGVAVLFSFRGTAAPTPELLSWAAEGGALALDMDDELGEVAPGRRCGLTVISGLDYDTMRLTPASRIRRIL